MIKFYKKRGETPLQALDRLRAEQIELKEETLSYAGRLDPMAEGILPVLVGEEENKNRKNFLSADKKYYAEFLIGYATDTGDVLGVIQNTSSKRIGTVAVEKCFSYIKSINQQIYPWYSSQTVDGVPLFEYARKKMFDIVRPKRDITIYSIEDIKLSEFDSLQTIQNIIEDIQKVTGDFRQEEIIQNWQDVIENSKNDSQVSSVCQVISCTLHVSSGTYIRGLCEEIEKQIEIPVVLHKLIRTEVDLV